MHRQVHCSASFLVFALAVSGCSVPEAPAGPRTTVRDFGAVGDGKVDDTEAVRRAVAAGTGVLKFPRGTYRLTEPVVIDLDRVGPLSIIGEGGATISMAGPGPAFRLVGSHEGTASPGTVKDVVWTRERMPTVDGIVIVGAHPEASGIEATGTMKAIFTRVLVRKALHGIRLFNRNRNVIISECHLYENRGVGIFLDDVNLHQINITNCHVSYNGGGGIVVRGGNVRNIHIGTCDIEGNMAPEGPPTANVFIDVRDGSVREGAIVGCTIQHTANAPESANVRLLGRSAEEPHKVGHFTIADNAMSDVQYNIHLRYARGVTITGNTLWKAQSRGILVEHSSNVVIGANVMDHNPDYRPRSKDGVAFVDSQDCTVTGLHVNDTRNGEAGLVLRRCRRFNVTDCMLLNCEGMGMLLDDVEAVRVSDCVIRGTGTSGVALRLTKGKGNRILDNDADGRIEIAPGSMIK